LVRPWALPGSGNSPQSRQLHSLCMCSPPQCTPSVFNLLAYTHCSRRGHEVTTCPSTVSCSRPCSSDTSGSRHRGSPPARPAVYGARAAQPRHRTDTQVGNSWQAAHVGAGRGCAWVTLAVPLLGRPVNGTACARFHSGGVASRCRVAEGVVWSAHGQHARVELTVAELKGCVAAVAVAQVVLVAAAGKPEVWHDAADSCGPAAVRSITEAGPRTAPSGAHLVARLLCECAV
jgi:hypothetical protein